MRLYNSRRCFIWMTALLFVTALAGSARAACTAAANPPGCVTVRNVCSSGGMDSTTIQGAVKLLPGNISATGNACVVIRDAATYAEQVTIPDVSMSSYTTGNNQIEILIDPGMSSGPVVSPPAASAAGFKITQASVTIGGGIQILPTNAMSYGIQATAPYVTISSVSVVDATGKITTAGIRISSWTTVSYSSITVTTAHGLYLDGMNDTVSYSTTQAKSAGFYALYLNGASSNTITRGYIANTNGDALEVKNGAGNNTVSFSTMTSNTGTNPGGAVYINSSSNTFTQDYFMNSNGTCVYFDASASQNTVSVSTAFGGGNTLPCVNANADSYDTITRSFIESASGSGIILNYSVFNTISFSSMVMLAANGYPLALVAASSNTITQSYLDGTVGSDGLHFFAGSTYNTISFSTIAAVNEGLEIKSSQWNVMVNCMVTSNNNGGFSPLDINIKNGTGLSSFNTISQSTLTNTGGGYSVFMSGSSSNTVSSSYVQGSTAVWITGGSSGTVLNSNTLVATQVDGSGIWLDGTSVNLNMTASSNTITGGVSGSGIRIDKNNGNIYLTTNTILSGAQYGIFIAAQVAGTQIYVASNTIIPTLSASATTYGIYLNGLTTGATIQNNGIYYRTSGSMGANTSYALYTQSAGGLNINHNQFNQPGMITAGSYVGVSLIGTTNTLFKFNDLNAINGAANPLNREYLLQLANGSTGAQIKNNIFQSSMTANGGSSTATIIVDGASQSGFISDYNDLFSFNGANTAVWGGTAYSILSGWQGVPASQDAHSINSNPLWFNTSAGSEDFHPQSRTGRYNPASQSFVQDCFTSPTIDTGDPSEPFSLEPSPNGGRVNQGSYGNTPQASETFQVQPPASIGATALIGQITVSWTSPSIPQSCVSYVDHYELAYSSVSSAGPFSTPPGGNPISSNTFVFLHSGLQSKTTYFYNVVTADSPGSLGNRSNPAQTFAVTPDSIAPAAVTNLAASQGSAVGQVNLNWTFPGDDSGTTTLPAGSQYAIQYTTGNVSVIWSTANAQVTISTSNVPVGALQSTSLSGLNQTTTYYFRLWTNHPGPVWSAPSNIASSFSKQPGPGVISISPADGSSCVAASTSVIVNFNKIVQHNSLTNAFTVILVKDNLGNSTSAVVAGTLGPASDSSTYAFTPSASLIKNGTYAISVSTLALDMQNNPLAQSTSAQFVTAMDRTILNTLTVPNLGVSVTVPGGALSADGCLVTSTGTVSSSVGMANQKLQQNSGDPFRAPLSGSIVDLKIYDASGNLQSGGFGSPVTVSLPYLDLNNDGVVDGTNPPIRASTLGIWWLDETKALWVQLPSSAVDPVGKRVTAETPHFTTFAIIGQATTDLSSAYAFPVPFKPSAGHTVITFTGLSQLATVRIYTVSGELVRELSTSDGSGQLVWDVKNSRGEQVVTGIYLYRVFNGSGQVMGKLAIIR